MYGLRTPLELEARSAAQAVLKEYRAQARAVEVMTGVACYLADDQGKSWRRWVKQIITTSRAGQV